MLTEKIGLIIIFMSFCILFMFLSSQNINTKQVESFSNNCKTYFINLDENIDRWNKISHKSITRFPAINGKLLDKEKLINKGVIAEKNILKLGQIGCALSHINVLKLIKEQDEEYGLILEDDVIIPDNFSINKLNLPKDFDIIFLGGCNIKGQKVTKNLIKPTGFNGSYNLCWHAVLVNKERVDKILNVLTPLYRPIDSQLRDFYKELDVYYYYPNIINQNKKLRSNRRDIDGLPQSSYWEKHHLDITLD